MNPNDLIKRLSDLNIRLQLDGGDVRWAARPGIVRDELLAEMREHKVEILALLKARGIGEGRMAEVSCLAPRVVGRGTGDFPQIYRPRRISEIYGQDETKKVIAHGLNTGTLSHTLMFRGASGTGKTTLSRIIAMGLNCEKGPTSEPCCECESCRAVLNGNSFAYQEIDVAFLSGVDAIRDLRQTFGCASMGGEKNNVYLFDESYRASPAAQAALLKPIEDVRDFVYFIFSTTGKMIEPLENRCMRFEFGKLSDREIGSLLSDVCAKKNLEANPTLIRDIIEKAEGMPRNALILLQQKGGRSET